MPLREKVHVVLGLRPRLEERRSEVLRLRGIGQFGLVEGAHLMRTSGGGAARRASAAVAAALPLRPAPLAAEAVASLAPKAHPIQRQGLFPNMC